MKTESIARFFKGKELQVEGYKVKFRQANSMSTLVGDTSDLFLEASVYRLSGTYILTTNILINNPEKLTVEDLYTEISNQLQETVVDQIKTNVALSRYFKEVE